MSVTTFTLSKPQDSSEVSAGVQAFVSEKLKNDLYDLVLRKFKESGISQSELAARLGKDKALLSRQLSTPSNWTIDTIAKMLFSIDGSVLVLSTMDPDSPNAANYTQPSWLQGRIPPFITLNEGKNTIIATLRTTSETKSVTEIQLKPSKTEVQQNTLKIKEMATG